MRMRWLKLGILFSICVAICAYLLDLLKLFDLKTTIIAIIILGFAISTLWVIVFKKRNTSQPGRVVVRGFAGR